MKNNNDVALLDKINIEKKTYIKIIIKKTLSIISVIFLSLIIFYIILSATIIRFIPTDFGLVLTKNNTYIGGHIPSNSQILISDSEEINKNSFMLSLSSFKKLNEASIVEVLAGPFGKISYEESDDMGYNLYIDSKKIVQVNEKLSNNFLEDEYLVRCVKGFCNTNNTIFNDNNEAIYIVKSENIFGTPLGEK